MGEPETRLLVGGRAGDLRKRMRQGLGNQWRPTWAAEMWGQMGTVVPDGQIMPSAAGSGLTDLQLKTLVVIVKSAQF